MESTVQKSSPVAVAAAQVEPLKRSSNYPEPFFSRMAKRTKRRLGDVFGLTNFGVNLTVLEPGGESSVLHRHALQDEFIFVVEGHPTLVTESGRTKLAPGMCAGFRAGGEAHQLINESDLAVVYLEVGDRSAGDAVVYPRDDLAAKLGADGAWVFTHKDGRPYD